MRRHRFVPVPRRGILALVMAVVVGGCSAVDHNLRAGAGARAEADSAIIVVHMNRGYQLDFHKGALEGEAWRKNFWANPAARSVPNGKGYLVLRVPPRTGKERYGLSAIRVKEIGNPPLWYHPCGGARTLTFEARGGEVVYVGDLDFEWSRERVSYRVEDREDDARAYVAEKFPSLAPAFVKRLGTNRPSRGVFCPSGVPMLILL